MIPASARTAKASLENADCGPHAHSAAVRERIAGKGCAPVHARAPRLLPRQGRYSQTARGCRPSSPGRGGFFQPRATPWGTGGPAPSLHPEGVGLFSPGQRPGEPAAPYPLFTPKGWDCSAQGNALGNRRPRTFSSPRRGGLVQPRATPWDKGRDTPPSPERARQAQTRMRSCALSGLRDWAGFPFPGRCPGLKNATPSG